MNFSNGKIIIEDPYLLNFLSKSTPEFNGAIINTIKTICKATEVGGESKQSDEEKFANMMKVFKSDFVSEVVKEVNYNTYLSAQSSSGDNKMLMSKVDAINEKVGDMMTYKKTNRSKMDEGEIGIMSVLENVLPEQDGYTIDRIGDTIDNGCDILVRKDGQKDIRIEVKNHKNNVPKDHVKRFKENIIQNDCSGIIVSIRSGIVGHKKVEVDFLSNKKMIVFLSNNEYDGEIIKCYINLINKFDSRSDSNVHTIDQDTLNKIKLKIDNFSNIVDTLKVNNKNQLHAINELNIDVVSELIFGNEKQITNELLFTCGSCGKGFKSKAGLTSHTNNNVCTKGKRVLRIDEDSVVSVDDIELIEESLSVEESVPKKTMKKVVKNIVKL
jgi:hypothetical protein